MRTFTTIALLLVIVGLMAGNGQADDDHDRAYMLRQEADILPLVQVLEFAGLGADDRILEIEAEFEDGRSLYEIDYVTSDGRIMEVEVDARTGEVLERKEEH